MPDYGRKQYFATEHPAAGPAQRPWHDGCSWMVLTDVEKNNIKIKAIVFRNTFRGVQNIVPVEMLFSAQTVLWMGLSGTLNKCSVSYIKLANCHMLLQTSKNIHNVIQGQIHKYKYMKPTNSCGLHYIPLN